MAKHIRVLFIEDSPEDLELTLHELRRAGFDPESSRVETETRLREALAEGVGTLPSSTTTCPPSAGPRR